MPITFFGSRRVVLAPEGLEEVVQLELLQADQHGRLFFSDIDSHFAQNTWLNPQEFKFKSISEASKHLRSIQRNWWLHPLEARGRAKIIQEQLPPLKPKPIKFPSPLPTLPMGAWTLTDENTMLYSAETSSPFPDGEIQFEENKTDPPSRAYLKLWELFLLTQQMPKPGEHVVDLGSSPGGWTWVLDQLGAATTSVDKAPLDSKMKLSPKVSFFSESAFGMKPQKVDWLFSDIICYPERLLELIHNWLPFARCLVCTIKFQGPTNYKIIEDFLKVPGSKVRHLFHNKHELTWYLIR